MSMTLLFTWLSRIRRAIVGSLVIIFKSLRIWSIYTETQPWIFQTKTPKNKKLAQCIAIGRTCQARIVNITPLTIMRASAFKLVL